MGRSQFVGIIIQQIDAVVLITGIVVGDDRLQRIAADRHFPAFLLSGDGIVQHPTDQTIGICLCRRKISQGIGNQCRPAVRCLPRFNRLEDMRMVSNDDINTQSAICWARYSCRSVGVKEYSLPQCTFIMTTSASSSAFSIWVRSSSIPASSNACVMTISESDASDNPLVNSVIPKKQR